MAWTEAQLHPLFGLELVFDRNLVDLAEEDRRYLVEAVEAHGVVVVRGQPLSEADLLAFGRSLGKVYDAEGTAYYDPDGGILRISNLDLEGNIIPTNDTRARLSAANRLWHTDSTFVRPRVSISLLNALVVTSSGGETEFCDTRLAWEALPDEEKEALADHRAFHTILHSRARVGYDDWTPDQRDTFAGMERPLVHVHEPSGRTALYLASHIKSVSGHSEEESQALVDDLTERATAPELRYVHHWRVGDLLLWDNRCTIHRAMPYSPEQARDLRSVRLVDLADI